MMLLRRRIRTCSKAGKAIDQKVEKSTVTNREAQFALKHPTAYKDILFAKEFNRAGIESGIGAASLTVATTMSHSSHALIEKVGGSCAPAAVVAWGVQSFDAAVSYAQGEISTSELVYDLGEKAASVAGGIAGGAAGGAIGTIAGAKAGAMVGAAVLASKAQELATNTVEAAKVEVPEKVDLIKQAINDFAAENKVPIRV